MTQRRHVMTVLTLWELGAGLLVRSLTWWRHQMETFSALLAICAGNSPVPGEFPAQRPVTRSFGVFFDLHPNKSKQWWGWWFQTPSCPLWHHRNELDGWLNSTTPLTVVKFGRDRGTYLTDSKLCQIWNGVMGCVHKKMFPVKIYKYPPGIISFKLLFGKCLADIVDIFL